MDNYQAQYYPSPYFTEATHVYTPVGGPLISLVQKWFPGVDPYADLPPLAPNDLYALAYTTPQQYVAPNLQTRDATETNTQFVKISFGDKDYSFNPATGMLKIGDKEELTGFYDPSSNRFMVYWPNNITGGEYVGLADYLTQAYGPASMSASQARDVEKALIEALKKQDANIEQEIAKQTTSLTPEEMVYQYYQPLFEAYNDWGHRILGRKQNQGLLAKYLGG